MNVRQLASLGAGLAFACIAALYLWNIEAAVARIILTFLGVFGVALLAAAITRMGRP